MGIVQLTGTVRRKEKIRLLIHYLINLNNQLKTKSALFTLEKRLYAPTIVGPSENIRKSDAKK
jgi:hypothetical protein